MAFNPHHGKKEGVDRRTALYKKIKEIIDRETNVIEPGEYEFLQAADGIYLLIKARESR